MQNVGVYINTKALAGEATEIWGGALMKFQNFSIAKIEFLWRALNFKRGHGPPWPPLFCRLCTKVNKVEHLMDLQKL